MINCVTRVAFKLVVLSLPIWVPHNRQDCFLNRLCYPWDHHKLAADQRFPLTWSPLACRRQSVCSGPIIINFWQHSPVTFTAWRWRLPGGRASTEQKRFVGTNALCHPVLTTDTKRKGVERNTTQQVVIIARNLCCMRNLYLSICDELFSTGSLQSGNPCFGTARRTRRSQQLQQKRG